MFFRLRYRLREKTTIWIVICLLSALFFCNFYQTRWKTLSAKRNSKKSVISRKFTEYPQRTKRWKAGPNLQIDANLSRTLTDTEFLHSLYDKQISIGKYLVLTEKGLYYLEQKEGTKELWRDEPYFSRRLERQHRCNNSPPSNVVNLQRMTYDDKHKVIMCVVPKDASTTWRKYMYYLTKDSPKDKSKLSSVSLRHISLFVKTDDGIHRMIDLPREEVIKKLLTYTTFFITRHPFERLISAYQSKFSGEYASQGKEIALRQAAEHLPGLSYSIKRRKVQLEKDSKFYELSLTQRQSALKYVEIMNSGSITFKQMADDIANLSRHNVEEEYYNLHWRPQTALCNPCAVNYDLIIQFDYIPEEGNYLLQYLQRNDQEKEKVFFNRTHHPSTNDKKTKDAFKQLSSKTIEELKKVYSNDFNILNYNYDLD